MFQWIRRIFNNEPVVVKIEVTINVPTIHVFTSGPKVSEAASPVVGSSIFPEASGTSINSPPPITTEEKIDTIRNRFKSVPMPEVKFGEERE
jgi:hypothetical protein